MLREQDPALARAAGPLEALLDNPDIREIRCTSAGRVFAIHSATGKQQHRDMDPKLLDGFLSLVADIVGAEWGPRAPRLHAATPRLGIRIQASRPPVSPAACMTLRKHPSTIYPLTDWVAKGILTPQQCAILKAALQARQTIAFSGAVGSSKTSLLNACAYELRETDERLLVVEDDPEVICTALDCEFQRCVRDVGGQVAIGMEDLCRDLLRHSPDRVIIGELRGAEALPAMQAFQTGHPGLTTVHAPSAFSTLLRVEQLIQITSLSPQKQLIAEALNLICHMEQFGRLWRCTDLLVVERDLDDQGQYRTRSLGKE